MMLCNHENRGADRARLRQGDRQAMVVILPNWSACCTPALASLLRLPRPRADLHMGTGRWTRRAAAAHRLDPTALVQGKRDPRLHQVGLHRLDPRACRRASPALFDHDGPSRRARSTCATTRRCKRTRDREGRAARPSRQAAVADGAGPAAIEVIRQLIKARTDVPGRVHGGRRAI